MYKKKIPQNQNNQTLKNPKLNKILNKTKCVCLYMYSIGGGGECYCFSPVDTSV